MKSKNQPKYIKLPECLIFSDFGIDVEVTIVNGQPTSIDIRDFHPDERFDLDLEDPDHCKIFMKIAEGIFKEGLK